MRCEFCLAETADYTAMKDAGRWWTTCFPCARRLAAIKACDIKDPRARLIVAALAQAKKAKVEMK